MRASIVPSVAILYGLAGLAPAMGEVLSISPAAFTSSYAPGTDATEMSPAGGYETSLVASTCEYAPVQLPDGAVVDALTVWVRDAVGGGGNELTVKLWEKSTTSSASATAVMEAGSTGSSGSIRAVLDFGSGTVDAATESWYLEACYGAAGLELHHVAISYSGPPAGIDTTSPAVVPAVAFRTDTGRAPVVDSLLGFVHGSFLEGGFTSECFSAPVTLPVGTSITMLSGALYDNDALGNFSIQLRRKRLGNSQNSQIVAELTTSGASGDIRQFATGDVSNAVVSPSYEYFLTTVAACPKTNGAHRLYAVRIHHEQPLFADGFESGDTSAWTSPPSSTSKTLFVPASAFVPSVSGYFFDGAVLHDWLDPVAAKFALQDGSCAVAPVTLPDGATLNVMTAYLIDTDGSRSLNLRLRAKRNVAAGASELASVSSPGSVGPTVALTLLSGAVTSTTHHYYLEACQPAGSADGAFGIQAVLVGYDDP